MALLAGLARGRRASVAPGSGGFLPVALPHLYRESNSGRPYLHAAPGKSGGSGWVLPLPTHPPDLQPKKFADHRPTASQ